MNPDEKLNKQALNKNDFEIGYDSPQAEVMIVTIPIRKWAEDPRQGDIYVVGVFEKAKRIALKNLELMRIEKKQNGVIIPTVVS